MLRFSPLAGLLLIAGLTLWVYLPAVSGGFILDNDLLLTNNPLIASPDGLVRLWCSREAPEYYPVSYSTLWLEWRLWGMNPTGYHVTNLLLHIVAAILLWAVLQKLSLPGAFLAALLFAVHPVNVESVAWNAQRRNVLAMVFFLLSILWYLRNEEPHDKASRKRDASFQGRWYWLSLFAFLVAMLSKGSVAVLPAILLGIIAWRRPVNRRDGLRVAPYFAIAATLTIVHIWFQTHGAEVVVRDATVAGL